MAQTALMAQVQEDIKKYEGRRRIVRSSLIQRLMTHYVSPRTLHPNPEDEFCNEKIGPNYGIITDYCKKAMHKLIFHEEVFDEPVLVVRMEPEGYMILNGHHRWAAAIQVAAPKIFIAIVNPRNV